VIKGWIIAVIVIGVIVVIVIPVAVVVACCCCCSAASRRTTHVATTVAQPATIEATVQQYAQHMCFQNPQYPPPPYLHQGPACLPRPAGQAIEMTPLPK
jgi:hypothetical protein